MSIKEALNTKKWWLPVGGSLLLFLLLALLYAHPVLSGKELLQHDIVQYKGGAKELLDYRKTAGEETYWSNSMFGGMPTYQTGAQFRGDWIKQLDSWLNFLPKPVNYLFLLFSGFFLLGMVTVRKWQYALLGALMFGLSTYFYIIIAAGHNGKVNTILYFAPLLAGIILTFIRQRYWWGFVTTALFMGLQIAANHPQMTYYLFLALFIFWLSELVRAIRHREYFRHFWKATAITAVACTLGVAMNSQRLLANAEYVKETVRGAQILNTENSSAGKHGMDNESLLMWSYGKLETLNLFIPRLMGGGSNEPEGEGMMQEIRSLVENNATSQLEVDRISQGLQSTTYWGDQPYVSGPAYQGAVVIFLTVFGFLINPRRYRYWLLGASALTVLLAWGSNFRWFSELFIDWVPFYNKFRAPSSILVVVELLFPLVAILGLAEFFRQYKQENTKELSKKLYIAAGSLLGLTLVLLLAGKPLLGFVTETEQEFLPPYLLDYLVSARYKLFAADAIKTLLYIAISAVALWLFLKNKISQNVALAVLAVVTVTDLWLVNRNYLNGQNFVDKTLADNPFQTEINDYILDMVGDNAELQSLLRNARVNDLLSQIAAHDKGYYRIYNQAINTFGENNTSYFKSSVGGYHAVKLRRYDDVINHYFTQPDSVKTPRILNMLNTRYMIFGDREKPQAVPNPYANGNAWFVNNTVTAKNPNEEIELIGKIDTKKAAVIGAEDSRYLQGKTLQADPSATIKLKKYAPNALQYRSESKTPQLAVFSEIYYPHGWKMLVDGREVPYIKANYLLRAVYVPAGTHEIAMIFDPEVIHRGKTISLIATILFILAAAGWYYMEMKKKKIANGEAATS